MAVIRIAKDRRREIKMKKNNQPKYQKKSDDEDEDSKSKKKNPKKTDLVNVYQIEVVPKRNEMISLLKARGNHDMNMTTRFCSSGNTQKHLCSGGITP